MFEVTPILDENLNSPLYIQLYEFLKIQIEQQKIKPGTRLPSKRKLANHLNISLSTVENALGQLMAEGYIESRERVGLFAVGIQEDILNKSNSKVFSYDESLQENQVCYDFSQGNVDVENFPFKAWRKITMESLQPEYHELLLGGHSFGEWGLRKEIADYLYQSRGVICQPEQIIIGAGTQYLLSLVSRIIGRGWSCSMEDPGFHRARESFLTNGLNVKAVPVDSDGVCLKTVKEQNSQLLYITPSHQFPTGAIMSIQKRLTLLEWASKQGAYIIEDDYDGEFRYQGKPIPSLQGLDKHDRVIYLGTFSKSLIPSLRLSYMVLPNQLLKKHEEELLFQKQTVSRHHQKTLEIFMKEGHWARHLNKMRTLYRKKQKALQSAILLHFKKSSNDYWH